MCCARRFSPKSIGLLTEEAVGLLQSLLPERPLNAWFRQIVSEGTGKTFELAHNEDWLRHTRPMVEAVSCSHHCEAGLPVRAGMGDAALRLAQRPCGAALSV